MTFEEVVCDEKVLMQVESDFKKEIAKILDVRED